MILQFGFWCIVNVILLPKQKYNIITIAFICELSINPLIPDKTFFHNLCQRRTHLITETQNSSFLLFRVQSFQKSCNLITKIMTRNQFNNDKK